MPSLTRWLAVPALPMLLVVAACGGESVTAPPPAPTTTAVFFRVDAQTCTGTSAVDFFIDGSVVLTQVVSAGQTTSSSVTTSQGTHVFGAQVSNTRSFIWRPVTLNTTGYTNYVVLLTC